MVKIAIMAAMTKELVQLKSLYSNMEEKIINGHKFLIIHDKDNEILLSESGMGKVCAAVNAVEIINNFKPDLLINSGCAGSLSNDVDVKDIVVATEISYHDVWCWEPNEYGQMQGFPAKFYADKDVLKKVQSVIGSGKNIHYGLICSGDRFVSQSGEIREILEHFSDVCAVDMEAAAIAQVCYMYNTKLLSIKVISDNPIRYKDGYRQYQTFWSELADTSFEIVRKILQKIL